MSSTMGNNNQEEKTEAGKAIETLSAQMKSDPGYAWSWHCNLAMLAVDAGAKHGAANRQAAQFMSNVFDVDTSLDEKYKSADWYAKGDA
jgi:hypothetical protein